jgi:hypothetical protein
MIGAKNGRRQTEIKQHDPVRLGVHAPQGYQTRPHRGAHVLANQPCSGWLKTARSLPKSRRYRTLTGYGALPFTVVVTSSPMALDTTLVRHLDAIHAQQERLRSSMVCQISFGGPEAGERVWKTEMENGFYADLRLRLTTSASPLMPRAKAP